MKNKDIKELHAKTDAELLKMKDEINSDLKRIVMDLKSGKLKNVMLMKNKRKDIARILTVLTLKKAEEK